MSWYDVAILALIAAVIGANLISALVGGVAWTIRDSGWVPLALLVLLAAGWVAFILFWPKPSAHQVRQTAVRGPRTNPTPCYQDVGSLYCEPAK